MLVCSRHWTLVQAKRYPKRRRDVDEAVARGLARRRRRVLGHCLSGTCKFRRVRSKEKRGRGEIAVLEIAFHCSLLTDRRPLMGRGPVRGCGGPLGHGATISISAFLLTISIYSTGLYGTLGSQAYQAAPSLPNTSLRKLVHSPSAIARPAGRAANTATLKCASRASSLARRLPHLHYRRTLHPTSQCCLFTRAPQAQSTESQCCLPHGLTR